MSRFIKLNHGIIDADLVIGVSDPFWRNVEVKPRKNTTKKPGMGIVKPKTRKAWGFNVHLERVNVTIYPTTSVTAYNSNTKKFTLQYHQEVIKLIRNEDETKDNTTNTREVVESPDKFFDHTSLQEAYEKG
jgi:hypothetical protein